VSSQDPRTKAGLYWGYTVRLASCLSKDGTSLPNAHPSLCLGDQQILVGPKSWTQVLVQLGCVSSGRCLL
jgi:hypothetical protein